MKKFLKIALLVIVGLLVIGWLFGENETGADASPVAANTTEEVESTEEAGATEEVAETPELEILQHNSTYEEVTQMHTIHCKVKNNSSDLVSYIDLKATFYDKAGNIVGTGMGNAANLAGGATKTIDVMAIGVENEDRYEVEIDNVMKEGGLL
jgi:hypothetical protein